MVQKQEPAKYYNEGNKAVTGLASYLICGDFISGPHIVIPSKLWNHLMPLLITSSQRCSLFFFFSPSVSRESTNKSSFSGTRENPFLTQICNESRLNWRLLWAVEIANKWRRQLHCIKEAAKLCQRGGLLYLGPRRLSEGAVGCEDLGKQFKNSCFEQAGRKDSASGRGVTQEFSIFKVRNSRSTCIYAA